MQTPYRRGLCIHERLHAQAYAVHSAALQRCIIAGDSVPGAHSTVISALFADHKLLRNGDKYPFQLRYIEYRRSAAAEENGVD